MEEILASIRRIIADDEGKPATAAAPNPAPPPSPAPAPVAPPKPAAKTSAPAPKPAPAPPAPPPAPPPAAKNSQEDIDAMLAGFDADTSEADVRASEPQNDVFELTEQMALPEPAPPPAPAQTPLPRPSFQSVEPADDLEFAEPRPTPAAYQSAALQSAAMDAPPPVEAELPPSRPLMSSSTMASVESAFNSLANTVLSNNARTLEDLVKEMLRPLLKAWIDDNLPNLVERIVRAEIERVSRGR